MPSRSRSSFSRTTAATASLVGARNANTSKRLRKAAAAAAPRSSSVSGQGKGRMAIWTTAGFGSRSVPLRSPIPKMARSRANCNVI